MPKYCLVGYLHSNMLRTNQNIVGGRLIDLKTLEFLNVDKRKLMYMIDKNECVKLNNNDSNNENFYLYINNKAKYISEFGATYIVVGKTKNCYMVTDGSEYIKLVDIEDICETDSMCKNYNVKASNIDIFTSRTFENRNNHEIRYLNNENLVFFPDYESKKLYKTKDINDKLNVLGAGYYITSDLDVIVTDAKILKLISDRGVMKTIGKYGGFRFCDNLNTVRLGDNVKFIYDYAFYKCKNLKRLNLGKSVKYIGEQAFGFCNSLEEIKLRDGIVQIAGMAFGNCKELKTIYIPKTLKNIQNNCFVNCDKLSSVVLSNNKHIQIFENMKKNGYIKNSVSIVMEGDLK